MGKILLEVKNVNKSFDEIKVFDSISFNISENESVGVLGKSGAGKSTLAKIILRLLPYDSGEICYRSIKLENYDRKQLSKEIQIVFQDPYTSLNPRVKIGDAIAEPILIHKIQKKDQIKQKTKELLKMVNLPLDFLNRFPHELSGGERQRVGIARALALTPKFLILDEPVSSLDLSIQIQILDLLKNLKRQYNLTYLFIAHDIAVVKYICDRTIKL